MRGNDVQGIVILSMAKDLMSLFQRTEEQILRHARDDSFIVRTDSFIVRADSCISGQGNSMSCVYLRVIRPQAREPMT